MAKAIITDPTKWAGSWGLGVGRSGDKWASNYIAVGPEIFQKAAAAVGTWQAAVASPVAAQLYVRKLNAVNFSTVTASVNGAGKSKYTTSGTTKQQPYAQFAQVFGPKLAGIVQNLPQRGPRGSAENRARLNQLLDQVQATRGTN